MTMQMDNTFAPIGGHLGGPTGARSENICSDINNDLLGVSAMTSTTSGPEQMRTVKAADVFPDLHHKMSKKIAQLTKVIYHLNTKNEDHQFELEEVHSNHQKEMREILADAAKKIKRFEEELASKKAQVDAEAQMEKLQAAHALEKKAAMTELKAFKRTAKEKEESVRQEYLERITELTSQGDKEKDALEESLARLQEKGKARKAALDAARTAASGNICALKERHQAELEKVIREGNEKFNKMIADQMQAQDDVRASAEMEAKEAKRVSELSMDRLRKDLTTDKESALSAARKGGEEELQKVTKSLVEKVEEASAEAARHRKAADEEKRRGDTLRAEKDRLASTVTELREAAAVTVETSRREEDSLRRRLESTQAEARRLAETLTVVELARDEAVEARRGAGSEGEGLRRLLAREIDEKKAFQRDATAALSAKDAELARRLGEIDSLRQNLQAALDNNQDERHQQEDEIQKVRESRDAELARADEMGEKVRATMAELELVRTKGSRDAEDLRSQLEYSGRAAAEMEARLRKEMATVLLDARRIADETAAKAAADMQALREASEGDTKDLSDRARRKEEALLKQLAEQTEDFKARLAEERAVRAREGEEAKGTMESLRRASDEQAGSLKQQMDLGEQGAAETEAKLRAQLETLTQELGAANSSLVEQKEDAAQHRREVERLTEALGEARGDLRVAKRTAEEKLGEQIAAAEAEARAKDDRVAREIVKELENASVSAEAKLKAEVNRVSRELHLEHEVAIAAAIAKERETAETDRVLLLKQGQEAAEKMKEQADIERDQLINAHETRWGELEAKKQAETSALIAEVQADRESTVQRLKEELKIQVERGERALEDARTNFLREKKAAITTAVSSAVRRRTAELETAKEEALVSIRSKLEGERDAGYAKLDRTKDTLQTKEEELARVARERGKAQAETEAAKRAAEVEMRRLRAASEAREAALVSKHATEMSHAVGRQRDELRDAETRFREKEQNLTARVDALHEEQERLERRYDNRPSREEDVARMCALEATLAEKDSLVAKTLEETAFVKRELLNREENYNKKFNANPVVGVMQVVKPRDIRGGSGGDPRSLSATGRGATQKRPPRYSKMARSSSVPTGFPTGGNVVGAGGARAESGRPPPYGVGGGVRGGGSGPSA